jgi:hypothetical protein
MKTARTVRTLTLIAAFACTLTPAIAAEIINNGGFSSGFAGWTVANQAGSDGAFFLQTGASSPVNGTTVPAPPGPTMAAMTDAQGPGTHVLYQDFVVPGGVASAVLSFDTFIGNRASAFFVPSPASLDFAAPAFNQQARIDILLGSATSFSVAGSDILSNVFQTNAGDALVSGYTSHSIDITSVLNAHLNTPLRLRFAETDNVNVFQFGVDNVSLATGDGAAVPEPSSLVTAALGALLFLSSFWLRHRCATSARGV